jgi:hypothetical protein
MRRPPDSVAFVARTHWIVAGAIAAAAILLHWLGGRMPGVELGARTYAIAGGIGLGYALAGTLVWLGAPPGRALSRICGLLYLPRPKLGARVWAAMNRADYQAHFSRR